MASQAGVDFLIALNEETVALHQEEMAPDGLVLLDERFDSGKDNHIKVPFKQFADDSTVNVAYLGILANLLGLDSTMVFQFLEDYFGAKKPEVTRKKPAGFFASV